MTDYTYEGIRRIPPPSDPPGIPEIECSVCKKWTSEETIVWAQPATGMEDLEGEEGAKPFCQGCCPEAMTTEEYVAHIIAHGLDNGDVFEQLVLQYGVSAVDRLIDTLRRMIQSPHRKDLKEVLMHLGNDLVRKHRYHPPYKEISAEFGRTASEGRCTDLVAAFTEFVNLSEEAREVLDSLGLDWSMPREVQGQGTQDLSRRNRSRGRGEQRDRSDGQGRGQS